MTVGEAIRAALVADATVAGLVGGRIYPALMPQGTVENGSGPAIVYTVASDVPQNALTGDSTTRMVNARVQIDAYSKTYLEAHLVAAAVDAVVSALATPALSAWREVSRDLYDNEAQLHRVSADFSVWVQ